MKQGSKRLNAQQSAKSRKMGVAGMNQEQDK
jgi:hypothetical protein